MTTQLLPEVRQEVAQNQSDLYSGPQLPPVRQILSVHQPEFTRFKKKRTGCFRCGQRGHYLRECHLIRFDNSQDRDHRDCSWRRRSLIPSHSKVSMEGLNQDERLTSQVDPQWFGGLLHGGMNNVWRKDLCFPTSLMYRPNMSNRLCPPIFFNEKCHPILGRGSRTA